MLKKILLLFLIITSCKSPKENINFPEQTAFEKIKTVDYELIKVENQKGLLILFPCFPCDASNTLSEFNITDICVKNGFSILAMNLNQRLYLKQIEKEDLAGKLNKIVEAHKLSTNKMFVGGFSSGGNVSFLICDFLIKTKNKMQPKGVFLVDSPIDLLGLYKTSKKNLRLNFSEASVQESAWIQSMLYEEFGNPDNGIGNYELNSPYTFETQNIDNLSGLKDLKIRFYTEPDLDWWKEYANNDYEDLNAFYIQNLADKLQAEFGHKNVEIITTENRGFRVNGRRHPHSWSIIDENDLLVWMKK